MKFKKIRDKHDKTLLISNEEKDLMNKDKPFLNNIKDVQSSKKDLFFHKKNKTSIIPTFKKKIQKSIIGNKVTSKKKTLINKNIDSSESINTNKKKVYHHNDLYNLNQGYIDRQHLTTFKLSKAQKNSKKNSVYLSKGVNKRSSKNNKIVQLEGLKRSVLQQKFHRPSKVLKKKIIIGDTISVIDLSNKMSVKSFRVVENLLNLGVSATANQILDQETAQLVAEEMGYIVQIYRDNALEISVMKDRDFSKLKLKNRPPVVTIMGHVDHGKTSLLDYIRSTKIVSNEMGGITQHIGAYHVNTAHGMITFLDTPGHAAFTAMRSRGTQITDMVVLVVAADDGVMPQTIEAIQHAKNANVPIIVAINKIDKTDANVDKIKTELVKYSIISEELGGENIFVLVSAKTGFGIDNLLSVILLQAEILELKSTYNCMASGVVIESFLDNQRGPVATVLIYEGRLNVNDIVVCGLEYGKIKLLRNEYCQKILSAGPSVPVEIFGLSGVPKTGDKLIVVRDEKKAKEVSLYRKRKFRELYLSHRKKINIENIFSEMKTTKALELNIILKADVEGSLGAIVDSLKILSDSVSKINIIMSGVGAITETDAYLSSTTESILIGFNVRANTSAKKIIELEKLDVRYYSIIYDLINDIKVVMSGLLIPVHKQKIIGLAEVRSIFKSPKFGLIAGCMVTEGVIKKTNPIRVLRDSIVVYEGELESLRRFKEDVLEVRRGTECGIGVKNYHDVQIRDVIEVFKIIK